MDIKKLQYLESVYRLKNLTQAAAEHYVAQPSITKAIQSLEDELGLQLIRRTSTGILFTAQGEQFMPHVYRILKDVRRAREEMDDLCNDHSRTMKMGISNIAAVWLLPLVYTEFCPQIPNCLISTYENTMENMLTHLLKEKYDLVYTIIPPSLPSKITQLTLMHSELQLIIPKEHPLAQHERIPIHALNGETLLTYPEGSLIRSILSDRCLACGASPILTCPSIQRSVTLELDSLGVGLVSTLATPISNEVLPPDLTVRGFLDPIYIDEGILYNSEHYLNRTTRTFIRFMKEKCRGLA